MLKHAIPPRDPLTPMGTSDRLDQIVARFVAGELALTSEQAAGLLWNELMDPGEWGAKTLGAIDALRALPRTERAERGVLKIERPTVIPGDLVIDGDLECLSHTLVVGDVRCTGYVLSGIHDCLIVGGDVAARALEAQRSYWLVGGSLEAETIWFSTYGSLCQRGEVRARLLMLQMYFELQHDTGIHADTRIETDYLPDDAAALERLRATIDVDGLLDANGDVDSWALMRRVARGERVFREP